MGSKSRIANHIVPIIQNYINESGSAIYIEPFVGGANVIDKIQCDYKVGADINKYLIALFQYIKSGGILPDMISRDTYKKVRDNPNNFKNWFVGCVGFLSSYNGKFFGGYSGEVRARTGTVRNYYKEACKNISKQTTALNDIEFICLNYKHLNFSDSVIYCDPPYEGTTSYSVKFNHNEFWETMRVWSRNNIVIVSEENAPNDFKCIWQYEVKRTLDTKSRHTATEKLFVFNGGKM